MTILPVRLPVASVIVRPSLVALAGVVDLAPTLHVPLEHRSRLLAAHVAHHGDAAPLERGDPVFQLGTLVEAYLARVLVAGPAGEAPDAGPRYRPEALDARLGAGHELVSGTSGAAQVEVSYDLLSDREGHYLGVGRREVGRGNQADPGGDEAVRAQVEDPGAERPPGPALRVGPGQRDREPHPVLFRGVLAVGVMDELLDPAWKGERHPGIAHDPSPGSTRSSSLRRGRPGECPGRAPSDPRGGGPR